jgi:hypothetical protein
MAKIGEQKTKTWYQKDAGIRYFQRGLPTEDFASVAFALKVDGVKFAAASAIFAGTASAASDERTEDFGLSAGSAEAEDFGGWWRAFIDTGWRHGR